MRWAILPRSGDSPPVLLKFRSSAPLIVTTASFAVFTDVFLYAVVVPVLPFSISQRAGVPQHDVQLWVSILLAIFAAALLISSPIWGVIADRTRNRKAPMLFGLLLLGGATLFLCLSVNLAMLIVGRALQGLSGALTWSVGLALVVDSVDRQHVGKATGWIGTSLSLGSLVGPLLGGLVLSRAGYYATFAMCFGLIAIDIVLRLVVIEVGTAAKWLRTPADIEGPEPNDIAPDGEKSLGPRNDEIVVSEARPSLARASSPAISRSRHRREMGFRGILALLRNPRMLAALWGTLVHATLTTAFDSTLPLVVSSTFHWGSTGAGLIFLPLALPSFLSPGVGALGDRYGPKWLCTCGFLLTAPFLICLRFVDENTIGHKVLLCGLLAGIGIGLALVMGPVTAEIFWALQGDADEAGEDSADEPYALAYGLYNMAFSGGAVIGPLMGGLIRDHAGFGTVGWSLALVALSTAIVQAIWLGGPLNLPKVQ